MFRGKKLEAGARFKLADLQNMNLSSRHCSIPAIKNLEAKARFELASFCLQDRRSGVR